MISSKCLDSLRHRPVAGETIIGPIKSSYTVVVMGQYEGLYFNWMDGCI
jgi:hypothetical protein